MDYTAGAATFGYGVFTAQPLFIGSGVAGLVLAHLNLSDRISASLRQYFGRKTHRVVAPSAPLEVLEDVQGSLARPPVAYYGGSRLQVGPELFSQSRHSWLKSGKHLNHTQ